MGTTGSGDAGDLYLAVGTSEVHAGTIDEFRDGSTRPWSGSGPATRNQRSVKGPLVVDLGWVTYFDNAGVDLLVEVHDALQREGAALRPVNAAGAVRAGTEETQRWGAVHGSDPIR